MMLPLTFADPRSPGFTHRCRRGRSHHRGCRARPIRCGLRRSPGLCRQSNPVQPRRQAFFAICNACGVNIQPLMKNLLSNMCSPVGSGGWFRNSSLKNPSRAIVLPSLRNIRAGGTSEWFGVPKVTIGFVKGLDDAHRLSGLPWWGQRAERRGYDRWRSCHLHDAIGAWRRPVDLRRQQGRSRRCRMRRLALIPVPDRNPAPLYRRAYRSGGGGLYSFSTGS